MFIVTKISWKTMYNCLDNQTRSLTDLRSFCPVSINPRYCSPAPLWEHSPRTGHRIPWNLPISGGHNLANVWTMPIFSILTLFLPNVAYRDGQITTDCVTRPCCFASIEHVILYYLEGQNHCLGKYDTNVTKLNYREPP